MNHHHHYHHPPPTILCTILKDSNSTRHSSVSICAQLPPSGYMAYFPPESRCAAFCTRWPSSSPSPPDMLTIVALVCGFAAHDRLALRRLSTSRCVAARDLPDAEFTICHADHWRLRAVGETTPRWRTLRGAVRPLAILHAHIHRQRWHVYARDVVGNADREGGHVAGGRWPGQRRGVSCVQLLRILPLVGNPELACAPVAAAKPWAGRRRRSKNVHRLWLDVWCS